MKIPSILAILLLSISLAALILPNVSSQSSTIVKVESSTSAPSLGQPFIVTISIVNVQNLYGLDVGLTWDASVLKVTNVETKLGVESFADGVLHTSSNSPPIFIAENNLTQREGKYQLTATSTAPAPAFSGSGTIAKITFAPISKGTSELNLQSDLSDFPPADRDPRVSEAISHTTQSSSVTVTEASASSTGSSSTPEISSPTIEATISPTSTTTKEPNEPTRLQLGTYLPLVILIIAVIVVIALYLVNKQSKINQS